MRASSSSTTRLARLAFLVLIIGVSTGACAGSSTPPGANTHLGSFEGGGYLFLRWQEGLEVMIWHDVAGSAMAQSARSTEDRLSIEQGWARSADGRSIEWEVRTTDGKKGEVQIGGAGYDASAGTLFIVTTRGGGMDVRQLVRDLSTVPLGHDEILAFAENDPDLAPLMSDN